MQRGLKELLIDDYFDLGDSQNEDQEDLAGSLGDDQDRWIHHGRTVKEYIRRILRHRLYDYVMACVIISSSITLGLSMETDESHLRNVSRQKAIYALDEILIAILVLEFLLKVYLDSFHYWLSWTNIFDFFVILVGSAEILWTLLFPETYSTVTNVLKSFRLLQSIRLYRLIKLSEGLQVLTRALMKTVLTYTFSMSILVFLFIYAVAVAGQMLYGKPESRSVQTTESRSVSFVRLCAQSMASLLHVVQHCHAFDLR